MSGNDRLRYTPGRGRRGRCFRGARCNANRVTRQCLALPRSRHSRRVSGSATGACRRAVSIPKLSTTRSKAAGCERIFIDQRQRQARHSPSAGQGVAGRRTRRRPARRHQPRPARPLASISCRVVVTGVPCCAITATALTPCWTRSTPACARTFSMILAYGERHDEIFTGERYGLAPDRSRSSV